MDDPNREPHERMLSLLDERDHLGEIYYRIKYYLTELESSVLLKAIEQRQDFLVKSYYEILHNTEERLKNNPENTENLVTTTIAPVME